MSALDLSRPLPDEEVSFEAFDNLMPFRVQEILLVSSLYDSFILREDGRLNELIIEESLGLNLQKIPGITHVSNCAEALSLACSQPRFNLIVTNLAVGEMDAAQLAREIKRRGLDVPVVVLAYDYREVKNFVGRNPTSDIERIFLWQGNARILVAIVKYIEDKRNVRHDTRAMGVPVLLVVENNIRYYSSFLPAIYTEAITQTRRVIQEGVNVAHRLMRMRARPKILLCSTYEEAARQVDSYQHNLLGIVSDLEFSRDGVTNPDAGFQLARRVRALVPDVPVVLQSSRADVCARAHAEGFAFLHKRSPTFLRDLGRLMTEEFGFGDFVFRTPEGTEVGRAGDLSSLEQALHAVPAESIAYHGQRNHFSHWLMARTEFALAKKLRPRKVSDFASFEDLRQKLIASIGEYRREQSEMTIGDFRASTFKADDAFFFRIGEGSLGGKARGLAFVRHLLRKPPVSRFLGVRVTVPPAVVLATDVFDRFMADNNLLDFAIGCQDDAEIQRRFCAAYLPDFLRQDLSAFLAEVRYPLAIRSSSLLEDSHYHPFTGVYETFMVGNCQPELELRLAELMQAIKLVYASGFSQRAKGYLRATSSSLEEEKMAVILQQVVGASHGERFYPDFAGVVRSRNYYPIAPMTSEDGIAAVALGMGRAVVEGGKCLSFCPRYPRHPVQFGEVEETLANSQSEFWALRLDPSHRAATAADLREVRFGLDAAGADGTLQAVGSTYSVDDRAIYDGLSRPGVGVVTFAPVLKHGVFPLAPLLDGLMKVGEEGLGSPIEIEFAVRLARVPTEPSELGFLQIRPLVLSREGEQLQIEEVDAAQLICRSDKVLGNGRIDSLHDIVVVNAQRFERGQSRQVAEAVAYFNAKLGDENCPYLLIGVGRWGSNDPWLGIKVAWEEISGARVIVEAGFRDFRVTPSQGSHFFQNLTAFQVGYFTVNPDAGEGSIDWGWLASQPAVEEVGCVRHLRVGEALLVLMNGRTSEGMIFKPGAAERDGAANAVGITRASHG